MILQGGLSLAEKENEGELVFFTRDRIKNTTADFLLIHEFKDLPPILEDIPKVVSVNEQVFHIYSKK